MVTEEEASLFCAELTETVEVFEAGGVVGIAFSGIEESTPVGACSMQIDLLVLSQVVCFRCR